MEIVNLVVWGCEIDRKVLMRCCHEPWVARHPDESYQCSLEEEDFDGLVEVGSIVCEGIIGRVLGK